MLTGTVLLAYTFSQANIIEKNEHAEDNKMLINFKKIIIIK